MRLEEFDHAISMTRTKNFTRHVSLAGLVSSAQVVQAIAVKLSRSLKDPPGELDRVPRAAARPGHGIRESR